MVRRRTCRGFTLIEVLVAMVVVAVLATVLLRVTGDTVRSDSDLEERTMATIVASNYLVRLQQAGAWPDIGELTDTVHMAGRDWAVQAEVEGTGYPALRRLSVHVAPAGEGGQAEGSGATLVGFAGEY